jgi:hypothetical protein
VDAPVTIGIDDGEILERVVATGRYKFDVVIFQ